MIRSATEYLETFQSDLGSLLDVVGFNRPSFVVGDSATMLAIDFAAAHADRMGSLVVIDGFAHRAGDAEGRIRSHIEHMRRMFNDGEGIDLLAPSFAGDPVFREHDRAVFPIERQPRDSREHQAALARS